MGGGGNRVLKNKTKSLCWVWNALLDDLYFDVAVLMGNLLSFPFEGGLPETYPLLSVSERRHSSSSKPSLAAPHTSVFSLLPSLSKSKGGCASGSGRSSSGGVLCTSSSSPRLLKLPKEKLPPRGNIRPVHPMQQAKVLHGRV